MPPTACHRYANGPVARCGLAHAAGLTAAGIELLLARKRMKARGRAVPAWGTPHFGGLGPLPARDAGGQPVAITFCKPQRARSGAWSAIKADVLRGQIYGNTWTVPGPRATRLTVMDCAAPAAKSMEAIRWN
jgi:hypothetical protein